jgi:hypothetical protein
MRASSRHKLRTSLRASIDEGDYHLVVTPSDLLASDQRLEGTFVRAEV